MKRAIQILSIFLLLTLASAVSAQTVTCGIVEIDGPATVDPGTTLVFRVKVLQVSKPEFKWNISVGTIVGGQGTDTISVDTVGLAGQQVTVTVELASVPFGCNNSASKTTGVAPPPPTQCAFDSYGDIKFEDEQARLDNLAIQVLNWQGRGLIQMAAGQKTFKGEAAYRLARAKSYLVGFRDIDSSRIITADCGFTTDLTTTLWVVPPGATLPECNTVGQIPLSEVKFTQSRPKSSKKRR